ncbi:MAG: L-aspartate oxidase [Bacteroidetes bacterium]|nr:L-aspartate oxidase [Bacteroidota bacterium]
MLRKMLSTNSECDFLIIGSGLAGLFAAYQASKYGRVLIITKVNHNQTNSWLAQGGIACAISEEDSTDLHFEDTLDTGRGLCDRAAVRVLVEDGVHCINELIEMGLNFDQKNGSYCLGLEGGHSVRRILHIDGSSTGEAIIKFLLSKIKDITNVALLENTQALDLIQKDGNVIGVTALSHRNRRVFYIKSRNTILASGGFSKMFSRNTNPQAAVADGIIMAINVGATVRNLEFTQFHPTAFYSNSGSTFLISEAVRGEGAYLLNNKNERFAFRHHKNGELSPRDILSKAIFSEIKNSDSNCVYLDVRHLDGNLVRRKFSNIYNFGLNHNIDITNQLIPISPAAHYSIGGIKTDLDGQTNLNYLFAVGEVASTLVHGANRLASNSLLECLVFSQRAVKKATENRMNPNFNKDFEIPLYIFPDSSFKRYRKTLNIIQNLFSENVGILRNKENLNKTLNIIESKLGQIQKIMSDYFLSQELGLLNLAKYVVQIALLRVESRGVHHREDFPELSQEFIGSFIVNNNIISFEKLNGN